MSKKRKTLVMGPSEAKCGHCKGDMVWKSHKTLTAKVKKQSYYYSKWELCLGCGTVWHHEEFKVKQDLSTYPQLTDDH